MKWAWFIVGLAALTNLVMLIYDAVHKFPDTLAAVLHLAVLAYCTRVFFTRRGKGAKYYE